MKQAEIKLHYKKYDRVIFEVMKDLDFSTWIKPWKKKRDDSSYFGALCREVISQQLSGKAAETILGRVVQLLPNQTFEPEAVLTLDTEQVRQAGMSYAKITYIKAIAKAFIDEQIDAKKLHEWDDETVINHLTSIKGVGPWTAEMFLMFTLGREDVFSFGDGGLRRGIERVYAIKKPTREQIEKIIAPWSPYKSYGSIALWRVLE